MQILLIIVPQIVVHKEFKFILFATNLLIGAGFFLLVCFFAMGLFYVSKLHLQLKSYNVENIKLLDGMHEGLLILKKSNKGVMFSNKQSQKLLEGALSNLNQSEEPTKINENDVESLLLEPSVFFPIRMAENIAKSQVNTIYNEESKTPISLD